MRTLTIDVETHDSHLLYSMPPEEFVRLIGYAWDNGDVVITTDLEEIRYNIRKARCIVGHNIHAFDLRAIFGIESNEPLELARQRRVYDTWVHAVLVNPAPITYVNRHGKNALADTPEKMTRWYSLDEQAYQLGVPGKTEDMADLVKEFGCWGNIPVDHPKFVNYLRGDVVAARDVAKALLRKGSLNEYAWREQEIAARAAVISSNGLRVDKAAAEKRRDELAARREEILEGLVKKYDFPTEGKSPWASSVGKAAILAALADHGITERTRTDWPRTATGNLSLSGSALVMLTKGTPAEDLGRALAELKGQRSLSQLALDSMHPDGKVHPDITMLQRSGRWSTTKPGLTVWTARGEGSAEKAYFIPDSEDEVLLEIDYSNADARIVAALSGDRKYAERFRPGADGHMINAIAAWGEETVKSDPAKYRQMAKPLGHGWSYGGRAKALAKSSGLPLGVAKQFCEGMDGTYRVLVRWQESVRAYAYAHGCVVNEWGRVMRVEKGREYTQAPALQGQSGTREIVCDALLRMPPHVLRHVKAQIHDAILFSVPKHNWEDCRDYLVNLMQTSFKPRRGGQLIDFPVESGPPGRNWQEASH